ncbi:zinc ribbon-containing protein [Shewanella salipaludis]|uniref:Zinc ribbon-containing protein n=1 Tax=Shewanella salipaludis TaxID=2723052 RepID=A0A972FXQ4_9GAMM|nr:zinc ribbon-containing protein [Shewanella salipaludis]NMH67144.1 zinc ribbon-containing protein [Shewanella salipaludis]
MSKRSSELLALYQALIERMKAQFAEDNSLTAKHLYQEVTQGKDYLLLKSRADADELALVEQFLKRDIGSFLQQQNDASLSHSPTVIAVENTFWHWLNEITDRSQVEWHELTQDIEQQGYYQSGDIVSQGKLICVQCGHAMDIEFPGVIPDCPQCDGETFTREALAP